MYTHTHLERYPSDNRPRFRNSDTCQGDMMDLLRDTVTNNTPRYPERQLACPQHIVTLRYTNTHT